MGRGHRGLRHGSEERARRAFLRPQAWLGKLSLLLFGKRIRSQADSRQGRGRASLHGLRAAQLGRVSRTNHRRPQDLGQSQTKGRSSGSAYRHRVQHQGLSADHSGLRLDEGRKAHRRGPSSRGQLPLRGLDFPPPYARRIKQLPRDRQGFRPGSGKGERRIHGAFGYFSGSRCPFQARVGPVGQTRRARTDHVAGLGAWSGAQPCPQLRSA